MSAVPDDKWESWATDLEIDRTLEQDLSVKEARMTPAALTDKAMRLRAENKERITFEQLVGETLDVKEVASLWLALVEWKTSAGVVEKAIADRLAVLLAERGSGLDVDGHAVFLTKGTKRETCIDEAGFFDWLHSNPDALYRILNPNAVKKGSLPPAVRETFFEQTIEVKPDFVPAPASVPLEVLEDIKQKRAL